MDVRQKIEAVARGWDAWLLEAPVPAISEQQAMDRNMWGPVWHGTAAANRKAAHAQGFKVFAGETTMTGKAHGFPPDAQWEGIPLPVDFLGFGIYFTTKKAIAKQFSGGAVAGMVRYYINSQRYDKINWGSPRTMMKWWLQMGYPKEIAALDRVTATRMMTEKLKQHYDFIWYKGMGLRRFLDGDQVCVYRPNLIYRIDKSLAAGLDAGARVRRKSDGMLGTVHKKENVEGLLKQFPGAAAWLKPGTKYRLHVTWRKGGTEHNVQDVDIEPAPMKRKKKKK